MLQSRQAVRIPNYEENGYKLRYPFSRGGFNTTDYTSSQELLGDIERIWLGTLEEELGITKAELKARLSPSSIEVKQI